MKRAKTILAMALALPVLALGGLAFFEANEPRWHESFTLKIEGYDPRDFLRGNYLAYRYVWPGDVPAILDYSKTAQQVICLGKNNGTATARLAPAGSCKNAVDPWPKNRYGKAFLNPNGIEGVFFLPEEKAPAIERLLRDGKHEFKVEAYISHGKLRPKQLLIDNAPWSEFDLSGVMVEAQAPQPAQTYVVPIKAPAGCGSNNLLLFDYDWNAISTIQLGVAKKPDNNHGEISIYSKSPKQRIQDTADLQALLAAGTHSFAVSVSTLPDETGSAYPFNLTINGKPWQEALDAWRQTQHNKAK